MKKPNEPFKQYIPVINNSEMYKLGKALTDKDVFNIVTEETEAIAHISDSNKDVLIQITEYDILKNPSLLLQATKKQEVVKKVKERLEALDQLTRDTYLILFTHWIKNKVKDNVEEEGKALIELDTIHFDYRGLTGKNKESTLTEQQYSSYVNAIDVLSNTRVSIDVSKETNIAYEKIKNLGWGAIEGRLIDNIRWVYNTEKTKIIGIWYDLGMIGEAYTQYIPQINNKYPTALLQLDAKNSTVKNIGNYLCYLHRCNENVGNKYTLIKFYNLMGESGYEIKPPRIQEGLNRFLKHLEKIKDMLINNKIISNIEIPQDIHSKNYKEKQIKVYWVY